MDAHQPGSHRKEEGHTGFLRLPSAMLALIFIARRIQPSVSLVDRKVYRILCTHVWTRTSRGHTGRTKVKHDFSIFLLRCLPLFLSREGFSRPFASATVKSNFVYPRIRNQSFSTCWAFFLFFFSIFFLCVCVFIKLHKTAQSGPVILVILCHSH